MISREPSQKVFVPFFGSVVDVEMTMLDKQSKGVPMDAQANDDVGHLDRFREQKMSQRCRF